MYLIKETFKSFHMNPIKILQSLYLWMIMTTRIEFYLTQYLGMFLNLLLFWTRWIFAQKLECVIVLFGGSC